MKLNQGLVKKMKVEIERFSIDKLVQMIVKAGMQIKVEVINIAA